jgi:hypothetical protein
LFFSSVPPLGSLIDCLFGSCVAFCLCRVFNSLTWIRQQG